MPTAAKPPTAPTAPAQQPQPTAQPAPAAPAQPAKKVRAVALPAYVEEAPRPVAALSNRLAKLVWELERREAGDKPHWAFLSEELTLAETRQAAGLVAQALADALLGRKDGR